MPSKKNSLSLSDTIRKQIDFKRLFLASSKNDYIEQLKLMLGDDHLITFLGGANNPLAKIEAIENGQTVVLRAVTSYKSAVNEGSASELALQTLQISPRFKKPLFREIANESDLEIIYYECSDYYPNGSLEHYFNRLRGQGCESQLFNEIRRQTRHLLFSLSSMRKKNLWHTDIKPSNIMLNDHMELVFSDTKGLLSWEENTIRSNRTETTPSYYDDSVFNGNQIDLDRLMQLNIATSIYEMLCGELPQKQYSEDSQSNLLHFDLSQDIFSHDEGRRMSSLISALCQDDILDLKQWIKQLSKPCWKQAVANKSGTFFAVSEQRRVGTIDENIESRNDDFNVLKYH